MGITVGDNFDHKSKKPLDGRVQYATLAAMKAVSDANIYEGCTAFCVETGKEYRFLSSNTVNENTGKWREHEGQTYTGGDNVEISNENVISATDTTYSAGDGIVIDSENDNEISADIMPSSDMEEVAYPLPPVTGATNPTGAIVDFMAVRAPDGYLFCNGDTYNISDYPRLAAFFESQFGTKNHFGGDGTTTFAVPDLRGEFRRCTGTNGHTNNGDGANVGVHQDATEHLDIWRYNNIAGIQLSGSGAGESTGNADSHKGEISTTTWSIASPTSEINANRGKFTSRPTNTSVLTCIKY